MKKLTISEQETSRILNMHKKRILMEQVTQPATTQPTTTQPTQATQQVPKELNVVNQCLADNKVGGQVTTTVQACNSLVNNLTTAGIVMCLQGAKIPYNDVTYSNIAACATSKIKTV